MCVFMFVYCMHTYRRVCFVPLLFTQTQDKYCQILIQFANLLSLLHGWLTISINVQRNDSLECRNFIIYTCAQVLCILFLCTREKT
jgi:hypothetical protein